MAHILFLKAGANFSGRALTLVFAGYTLEWNDEAVHRSVAVDEIDPLHRNADGAIAHDQTMKVRASEQPLLLAAILDQDEFRAHEGAAVCIRIRKAHISHDPARAGSWLL